MTGSEWMDLAVLERKKYNYLNEVMDLSQQMGGVLDRNDEVSVKILLAMREDPLLHLREVDQTEKKRREALAEEDQERVTALLAGAEPRNKDENIFQEQAGKARRLLERVVELDRRLNLRISGKDSFYRK
ncbi:MAG: hypothetical protein K2O18_00320 [Oscillospiraceae bacterium]|nr:hypothetical protein [Oscillospiraceae bacterium]